MPAKLYIVLQVHTTQCTVNTFESNSGLFRTYQYKIFIFAQIELIFVMEAANDHIPMVLGVWNELQFIQPDKPPRFVWFYCTWL